MEVVLITQCIYRRDLFALPTCIGRHSFRVYTAMAEATPAAVTVSHAASSVKAMGLVSSANTMAPITTAGTLL